MLSLLDEKPHVTVGDLYQLSIYLFNLSNAVKQAVKKDLAKLSEPDRKARRAGAALLTDRPPSIIDQWASTLRAALDDTPVASPESQPGQADR